MSSILVLGGAGYIGSHTVYELIEAGENVVVVDNLETGFRKAVHPDAKFYQGDIRDRAFIDSVFEKEDIDGVIHFAANSQVGESMVNPLKYYNNNLCGTEVLLESMVAHGINKIVFSSTAATYGEPERIPILETDRTVPTNCYGETKLSMEKMFKWTANAHDLRFVSLRYFNACGAHPKGKIGEAHNPETHLIPLILQVPNGKREYGDYYLPDLEINEEEPTYGKYGIMRKQFLKEHWSARYQYLVLTGKLTEHLNQVDKEAREKVEILVEQMAEQWGVTEELKMQDQMEWVRRKNNIQATAEEIAYKNIIFM